MAPRTRNKKPNKQIKLPTHAGDDDYGRPPGTATRRAGPSRAPTQALSERDHTPHHQNDSGAPTTDATYPITSLTRKTDKCWPAPSILKIS